MFFDGVLVYDVHHLLKGARRIGKSKEHYERFPMSKFCFEGCLPFISLLDTHIVISL
jgi:hypothetical protein